LFSKSSTQQRSIPALYQWFRIYYQLILNKVIKRISIRKNYTIFFFKHNKHNHSLSLILFFVMAFSLLQLSLIMYNSFQMLSDVHQSMSDKIELYNKIVSYAKKFNAYSSAIVMNLNGLRAVNFRGDHFKTMPSCALALKLKKLIINCFFL
jgi:hypothetical protein